MSDRSGIEWTDTTWNCILGCSRVSGGCLHCYPIPIAHKLQSNPNGKIAAAYEGLTVKHPNGQLDWSGVVRFIPERLEDPFHWKKPRRVFVNSMSDLFHEQVSDGVIAQIWDVMARNGRHSFQILTKRPERMRDWVTRWADLEGESWEPQLVRGPEDTRRVHPSGRGQLFAAMLEAMGEPPDGCAYPTFDWMEGQRWWPRTLPNIWLGVSVEDQKTADERIPLLLQTPADVRFISYEPALGPVDLRYYLSPVYQVGRGDRVLAEGRLQGLDWVIVGGESGHGARPFKIEWAQDAVRQCRKSGVPCFVKQLGSVPVTENANMWDFPAGVRLMGPLAGTGLTGFAAARIKLADPKGGNIGEWPHELRVRQMPGVAQSR